MVENKRIELNAFVKMDNHIHFVTSIQLSFMKFIAQQIKFVLAIDNPVLLEKCKVDKVDREYQIWKRKPLSFELSSEKVILQKLDYIPVRLTRGHYNPVKAGICIYPKDYHFSSALFYEKGIDHFKKLIHYMGE